MVGKGQLQPFAVKVLESSSFRSAIVLVSGIAQEQCLQGGKVGCNERYNWKLARLDTLLHASNAIL